MSWSDVEPLSSPRYEELSSITRSLHLRQAQSSHVRMKLTSHKIATKNVKTNAKVLWFAPTKPMNQHNKYGNVSFTLEWSRALDQFGPYLYYMDQKRNNDIIYSRVLLSDKCHSNLTPVITNDLRMPLCKIGGKYHVATACDGVTHVVEIGIEADAKRGKRLYANCKIQANDHSSANQKQYPGGLYSPCSCHRYFKKVCPSPYTAQQTRAMLNKQFSTMFRDQPSWNHAQVVLETIGRFHNDCNITEEDENEYEDDEYIVNYDDHENVTCLVSKPSTVAICADSDDDDEGSSQYGVSYGSRRHGPTQTRDDSSDDDSYGASYGSRRHGQTQTRDDSSDDDSYGASYASRRHGPTQTRDDSSDDDSYGASRSHHQTATRHEQDEGWSTGSKVALVAGGLALFAGLAAAFAAGSGEEDKKKKKRWE